MRTITLNTAAILVYSLLALALCCPAAPAVEPSAAASTTDAEHPQPTATDESQPPAKDDFPPPYYLPTENPSHEPDRRMSPRSMRRGRQQENAGNWGRRGNRSEMPDRERGERGMSPGRRGKADARPDGDRKMGPLQQHYRELMQPENLEKLFAFLAEHEPSLAAVLKDWRSEDPEQFERRLPFLAKLYSPVMEQMKRDPEMANLSLKRIRFRGKVDQTLSAVRDAAQDSPEKSIARENLRDRVTDLYELILEQQELHLVRAQQRIDGMEEWRSILRDRANRPDESTEMERADKPQRPHSDEHADMDDQDEHDFDRRHAGKEGKKDRRAKQADRTKRRGRSAEQHKAAMTKRIEKTRQNIGHWRQNREKIIDDHIAELLSNAKAFPWGK